jgi:hypothetical protein
MLELTLRHPHNALCPGERCAGDRCKDPRNTILGYTSLRTTQTASRREDGRAPLLDDIVNLAPTISNHTQPDRVDSAKTVRDLLEFSIETVGERRRRNQK